MSEIDWGNLLAHVEEHLAKAPELRQYPLANVCYTVNILLGKFLKDAGKKFHSEYSHFWGAQSPNTQNKI